MKDGPQFYVNFLIDFLNLELATPDICKFLKQCNKIIPIKNLNDCIELLLNLEKSDPLQVWQNLPTESKKKFGKFYRKPNDKDTIYIDWEIRFPNGQLMSDPKMILFDLNEINMNLQSGIDYTKKVLIAAIELMISGEKISNVYKSNCFICLADWFPMDKICLEHDSIMLKPDYKLYWGLTKDYIEKCISYAFFKYVTISNNLIRKLKICPYCNKFYIAKSTNRSTRCYEPDCEKAYQRHKKRKQRDKDPVKYN